MKTKDRDPLNLASVVVFRNITVLTCAQIGLYLIPWVTLLYLLRVLGTEVWGRLVLAQLIIAWFCTATAWGFPWTITQKVSANRDDPACLRKTLSVLWWAQLLLALASTMALFGLTYAIPLLRQDSTMYLFGAAVIISGIIFPTHYLSGLERMFEVALVQLLSRLGGLGAIVLFVQSAADAPLVIAITAISTTVVSLLGLRVVWKRLELSVQKVNSRDIQIELKEGLGLMFSTGWLSFQSVLIPLVLGQTSGATAVGFFALADRIRTGAQSVLGPLLQATYPRSSYLWRHDLQIAKNFSNRLLVVITIIGTLISLLFWFCSEQLVLVIGGAQFSGAADVLRWMAPIPLLAGLTNFFGVQIMISRGRVRPFNLILFLGSCFCALSVYPLIIWQEAVGAALTLLILEFVIAIGAGIFVYRQRLLSLPPA